MKRISVIFIAVFIFSGCALFEIYDYSFLPNKGSVEYAYRNYDRNQPKIEISMSRQDVLDRWGAPILIVVNKEGTAHIWNEMWVYKKILSDTGGLHGLGKHIAWEIFFSNDTLERISMYNYDTVSRTSEEVLANWQEKVSNRLEFQGLKVPVEDESPNNLEPVESEQVSS